MSKKHARGGTAIAALLLAAVALPGSAQALEIRFRNFSGSAAIGPPADAFGVKLADLSRTVIGPEGEVKFSKISPMPAIPAAFNGDIVAAVGAGAAGGGFDAAYNSGSELNRAWGFIYNSGVPFGPNFDEHLGFLYGKSVDGGQLTGLELIQSILDAANRNVVVLPIVGSSEQLSGYFYEPIGDAPGRRGIGLEGFCQRPWKLRYLSPGENVINAACDALVAERAIPAKNLSFIAAIPGGGSLVNAVKIGELQGFEFATPVDDVSQLFNTADNPGTVGVRYVHFPGWQQQFLITWMIINKDVWNSMTPAQRALTESTARDHLVSSYGENVRKQGAALKTILAANSTDANRDNDMVLVNWPKKDQALLQDATIQFLNDRANDASFGADRADFVRILEAYRNYVRSNDVYWDDRGVSVEARFDGWKNPLGESWEDVKGRCHKRH
jgi:TRAP-type mannitol/chloroaromatic compound transport system substrate-binding protein